MDLNNYQGVKHILRLYLMSLSPQISKNYRAYYHACNLHSMYQNALFTILDFPHTKYVIIMKRYCYFRSLFSSQMSKCIPMGFKTKNIMIKWFSGLGKAVMAGCYALFWTMVTVHLKILWLTFFAHSLYLIIVYWHLTSISYEHH